MGLAESKQVVRKEQVDALMTRLPGVLVAAAATIPDEEKDHYKVAVNACEPDMLPKFRADIRIYMEACHYSSQKWEAGVVFLQVFSYVHSESDCGKTFGGDSKERPQRGQGSVSEARRRSHPFLVKYYFYYKLFLYTIEVCIFM